MGVYLFDLFIGVIFGGMIVASFFSKLPTTKIELIFAIIFAAMCIVVNHGVENEDYLDEDG